MIGRKQEVSELNRIYNRNKAELVTTFGLTDNEYSSAFVNTVTLEVLFR